MNLLDYRSDTHSSTGNDGIIEQIFSTLGVEKGLFVEFGAWDGLYGCNCRKLQQEGWDGIFIEPESNRFEDLKKNYGQFDNITCINSIVGTTESLFDDLVDPYVKDKIDFCSIDIDGLDLAVFETIGRHLPDVVCIEGGQMLHPGHERIPDDVARHNIQQSLEVMVEAFEKKGYQALCSYQDTFFIKRELADPFGPPASIMDLYLDGIAALARRIPWIRDTIAQQGLRNPILDEIVSRAGYEEYGYEQRKQWAVDRDQEIKAVIEQIRSGDLRIRPPRQTEIIERIRDHVGKDAVVVEVGAHFGEDTTDFIRLLGASQVYSFEPDPRNLKYLTETAKGKPIEVIQAAASDADAADVEFNLGWAPHQRDTPPTKYYWIDPEDCRSQGLCASGASSLKSGHPLVDNENKVSVRTCRLDTWMNENSIETIDLLWVDVQGAEEAVLKGLGSRAANVRFIYIEFGESDYDGALDRNATLAITRSLGFELVESECDTGNKGNLLLQRKISILKKLLKAI